MKKTVNINLGGYAFVVDDDAVEVLREYLDDISSRLSGDSAEISFDVETRIAEMFNSEITIRTQVVDMHMVQIAIKTMGPADEFGEQKDTPKQEPQIKFAKKTPCRLYRNTSNGVFAGICAGIAEYANMDISSVRLITFVLVFFGGISIWGYVILWIALPVKPLTEPESYHDKYKKYKNNGYR